MKHWHEIPEIPTEVWNDSEQLRWFWATLKDYECCKTCYFYRWGGYLSGSCRRYAPAISNGDMFPNDWCGEYKPRESSEVPK